MAQQGANEPWDALAGMRTEICDNMVEDPQVLRDNQWPYTIGLLRVARERFCRTALATMSYRKEALHVLRSLELEDLLDEVLTSEGVQNPKPDPEIYILAAHKLEVDPQDCLVLEDSPNGVQAGVAAGMNVIAMATPFTI
jgi:HAD superfamily hydrolase (TIGR01509 family)